jgi:hypothetical protein
MNGGGITVQRICFAGWRYGVPRVDAGAMVARWMNGFIVTRASGPCVNRSNFKYSRFSNAKRITHGPE